MGVHNMALAHSEQRHAFGFENFDLTLTSGDTGLLVYVPWPSLLEAVNLGAFSVQSSPFLLLTLNRFIPGTGFTSFALGTTFAPRSFGTSGVLAGLGVTLSGQFVSGLSGIPLMANDVIGYQVGGTGGTCLIDGLCGSAILRPVQDRKYVFNTL